MAVKKDEASLARRGLTEFRLVEEGLKSLRERARRLAQQGDGDVAELQSDAAAIAEHLKIYLSVEEEEGLFECLLDHLPGKASEIDALRREHGDLTTGADELVQASKSLTAGAVASFGRKVMAFTETFHRHEDRETLLYQRACVRDEGSKD